MKEVTIILVLIAVQHFSLQCDRPPDVGTDLREDTSTDNLTRVKRADLPWEGRHYAILINEINTDSPLNSSSLFIELRVVATKRRGQRPKNKLQDYFLLMVRADPAEIVFYLDMGNLEFTEREGSLFLVLGEADVKNLDVSLRDQGIQSIYRHNQTIRPLPSGNDSPYAILLLNAKNKRRVASSLSLYQNPHTLVYEPKKLIPTFVNNMKSILADMVVYGKKAQVSTCNIFDQLWPTQFQPEEQRAYILRDWDMDVRPDYSLNRCIDDDNPFQPDSFRYGKPTPGSLNDCEGPHFYVEDIIDKIAPLLEGPSQPLQGCSTKPNIPSGRYSLIDEESLAEHRENLYPHNGDDLPVQGPLVNTVELRKSIAIKNAEIQALGGSMVEQDVPGTSVFDANWIVSARDYLSNDAAILTQSRYQKWVRVNIPGSNGRPVSFYCNVCVKYFADAEADIHRKKPIMTPDGYYNKRPYINQREIERHSETPIHLAAEKYWLKRAAAKTEEERMRLKTELQQRANDTIAATIRMIRTVFTEVQAEVPFMHHHLFVELQKENGVDLGFMYFGEWGARDIVYSISTSMHEMLLRHLVTEDKPFSLICDATTTTKNVPYLNTYIQTLEDNYPINYYYRLLDLTEGEAAKAIFNSFNTAVDKDDEVVPGFKLYVKNRLAVFVSDNAAVMIGSRESFLTLLSAEVNRTVPNIGCMAHKMSLVLKSAIRDTTDKDLAYIEQFEKDMNDLYVFYNSRGSKRFQHLSETADEFNIKPIRFKKHIVVRWAAAEEKVVDAVIQMREIAEEDLKRISDSPSKQFLPAVRNQAQHIWNSITDTTTVLLYYEFSDFLSINKLLSVTLQQRAGILLDHIELIENCLRQYRGLKRTPGPKLEQFIKTCECKDVCSLTFCELKELESCPVDIICNDRSLGNRVTKEFKLSNVREKLYTKMTDALTSYLNFPLIFSLNVFNNRKFIANKNMDDDAHRGKFQTTCYFLKHDTKYCEELRQEYILLVEALTESPEWSKNFDSEPSIFWPLVLEHNLEPIKLSAPLKMFMEKLLVMFDSSAESERGFSVMARILHGARSNLRHVTLDALLRIRINAAKKVSDINVMKYATDFALQRYLVDESGQEYRSAQQNYKKKDAVKASRLF